VRKKDATTLVTTNKAAAAAADRLQDLATNLAHRGFRARMLTTGDTLRLWVQHRSISRLSDTVYVAPAEDGSWWLWWSWDDQLAPVNNVDEAAFKIAYVLTPA
jgi:hypothetical protein